MSLYKRGKTWWVSFTAPNGQRVRCTSGTEDKTQALEFHDKLKVKYWTIQKLGDKAERTWQEVVVRFIRETNHKASHKSDLAHLRWLDPYLKNKLLSDITRDFVDDITHDPPTFFCQSPQCPIDPLHAMHRTRQPHEVFSVLDKIQAL